MNKRAVVVLGLALLLAGLSVTMVQRWLHEQTRVPRVAAAPTLATEPVVVAAAPLAQGAPLDAAHLRQLAWPVESMPPGAFHSLAQVLGDGQGAPRVALSAIVPGEPILQNRVSGFGGRATLSAQLPKNARAVTIRVNDVVGVAGFVLPGDHVDIVLTRQPANKDPESQILLQDVKVLGIDQTAAENHDKPILARAVTLEVSPLQAQKIALGAAVGTLSLALRNDTATEQVKTSLLRVADLFQAAPPPVARHHAAPAGITVWRGLSASHVTVAAAPAPRRIARLPAPLSKVAAPLPNMARAVSVSEDE